MHRRIYQAIRARDADTARAGDARSPGPGEPAPGPGAGGRRDMSRRDALPAAPSSQFRSGAARSPPPIGRLTVPMKLFDLSGRTAVVVGGTSGIGRALALGLADAGADVVASGRRVELVKDVAAEIEARGRRTLRDAADVRDVASLERLRDECLETFGRVDILLAVAGTTKGRRRSRWTRPTGTASSTRT